MNIQALWLALLIPACVTQAALIQAAETPINIPHDPHARYALLEKSGHIEQRVVVTRRDGLLGVLYSRHVYNCSSHTVALLGTGESLESLDTARPLSGMLPVVENSTAYYLQNEACSKGSQT